LLARRRDRLQRVIAFSSWWGDRAAMIGAVGRRFFLIWTQELRELFLCEIRPGLVC
jgi:hypothetical protein